MIQFVDEATIIKRNDEISAILPLTKPTGKIRLKLRNSFCEYGNPFAPRQNPISLRTYIEWQIGYDHKASDENKAKTCLVDFPFKKL